MADQSPISLSTGKKVYSLEYAFDYNAFILNTTGHGCTAFCKYLGNSSSDPSSPLAFHVHGEGRRISHQLLKDDGFFLGKWCKDKAERGIEPAYCEVFERHCPELSGQNVAGEYVVILFPNQKSFADDNKKRQTKILKISVMCMYIPLFMPHIRCMCHFGLVGKGSYGAVFRIKYTKACHDSNSTSRSPSPPPLTCVVKRVDVQRRSFKLIMRESWFLRQLHHPNIAQLLHQYTSPNSAPNDKNPTLYFVQEDCGQTLRSYLYERIKKAEPVPLQIIDSVIQGLLSALVCLEQHGILHRDIKDDNCLISGEGSNAVAKLIDFGLAKKFDVDCLNVPPMDARQRQCDDPAMSASCEESAAAAGGAGDEDVDDQSKLFRGDRQFAPETLGMEQLKLKRQFVYKSDLWAVGVWILYPMLFWSCHSNMRKYRHPLKFDDRAAAAQFPHQELWSEGGASTTPKPYTHKHLHKVIKEKLLDKHQGSDDHHRFHTLCEVLERMCDHDPADRFTTQQCLDHLTSPHCSSSLQDSALATRLDASRASGTVHAAPAADAFNDVCKFIDKFCASGHFRGSAKTLSPPQDTSIFVNFKFTHLEDEISCCYEQLRPDPSWPQCLFRWPDWLFVRKGITNMPTSALTYQDCLTPDFYVRPPRAQVHGFEQPRAIFLPRNLFCFGVGCGHLDLPGMLDISNLTLITQRDWFTVFRYHKHGDPPFIIKHTSLNSVTFKYLLQEKAMFFYLNHPHIANEIRGFKDFHPLVMFTDFDPATGTDSSFTGNDRFVFYEDGGRPMDIQLQAGWRPTLAVVHQIARQLVDVLDYFRMKKVVHRKLSLGTVVCDRENNIKIISLGDAKFVGQLDYEQTVQEFTTQWQGVGASSCSGSRKPNRPEAELQNVTSKKYNCADPLSRNEPPSFEHDW